MANRTRNIVLRVPVTAEERAMIERKMQQMGTGCFSVYARKMLIDGYVIRLDYSDVKKMTAELEMSRNVQSGNTQNLKSTVIQRSFPKWSVAERRKTAAAPVRLPFAPAPTPGTSQAAVPAGCAYRS